MSSVITGWILALALGVRHASEPDHLVAVSTLVAGERNAKRAARLGAIWGVGHSLALLAVGGALLIAQRHMPERAGEWFELGVAVMLLVLGGRSIAKAVEVRASATSEREHASEHEHGKRHGHRSLIVGLVHGLAGSGALTALALSTMPSIESGFAYMAFFGLGSVVGMAALSGLIGAPLARFARKTGVRVAALATAGVLSIGVGIAWGWPLIQSVTAG